MSIDNRLSRAVPLSPEGLDLSFSAFKAARSPGATTWNAYGFECWRVGGRLRHSGIPVEGGSPGRSRLALVDQPARQPENG